MRISGVMVAVVLLAASGCSLDTGEQQAALDNESDHPGFEPGVANLAGGNKVIGVGSRNLYLGSELGEAMTAQTFEEFLIATTNIWLRVVRNDFHIRVQALADEIAARRPALVGLQEAYTWRIQVPGDWSSPFDPPNASQVVYDYVPELLAALAERDLVYRVVADQQEIDFEAPTLIPDGSPPLGIDIRMTDHDAILAREDITTGNPTGKVFDDLMPLVILGIDFPPGIPRGYVTVDAKVRGEWLTFASAHLESFDPGGVIRTLQGEEYAGLAELEGPVIAVGDFNSAPGTWAAAAMTDAGFEDVWAALYPEDPGLSCCWPEELSEISPPLDERDDYVFTHGLLEPRSAELTGEELADRYGGLWPSDHAGLFATLRIEDARFSE